MAGVIFAERRQLARPEQRGLGQVIAAIRFHTVAGRVENNDGAPTRFVAKRATISRESP